MVHDDGRNGRRVSDRSGRCSLTGTSGNFWEDRTNVWEGDHLREWGAQGICSCDKCFPSRYSLKPAFLRFCKEECAKLLASRRNE